MSARTGKGEILMMVPKESKDFKYGRQNSAINGVSIRLQWGSWNNSLNWRKVFKFLNFIPQT